MRISILKIVFDFLSNRFRFVVSLAPVDDVSFGVTEFDSPTAFLMEHNGDTVFELQDAPQVLTFAILVVFRPRLFQTVFDKLRPSPLNGRNRDGLEMIRFVGPSLSELWQQIGTSAEDHFADNQQVRIFLHSPFTRSFLIGTESLRSDAPIYDA